MSGRPEWDFAGSIQAVVQRSRHVTRVHFHETIGSTNAAALELAKAGAPHGTLVIAEQQTAGRGRMGRRWESPPGVGLWFSWVLRPPLPLASGFLVTVAGALSVVDAVARLAGRVAHVRWPNDVLVGERKLAGILAEATGQGEQLEAIVLGMGVNVNQSGADFPAGLDGLATSLFLESGHAFDRSLVLAAIIESFEFSYGVVTGRAVAVGADGALVVEVEGGTRRSFHAGDVRQLREAP
ncbi:MAG: BirA family transcriptional regulator, biotin operon repressor / biotin-acetyl-CoA-carboxylase ligase [bacterium]|nr:MAG: BirA family transcriptional regulator, biotin operon repressor / biotin-acetyl-CoA-carboxylase ligase [bacterium]